MYRWRNPYLISQSKPETPAIYSFAAKSDKCVRGKSCGATCIYAGNDCVLDLDPATSAALSKVIPYLKSYVSRGGQESTVTESLERLETKANFETVAKNISKSIDNMEKKYPDPKEREEKINQVFDLVLPGIAKKGDTGEKQAYDQEQIEFLMKNKKIDEYEKIYQDVKSGKLKTPEEVNAALRPLAADRRKNEISDEQVDLAMSMIPTDLKASLSKQGQPGEWGKWGAKQSTLDVPTDGHTPTNKAATERARFIVRIGMEEGMRDMYTGQRVGFGDIDLEHTIPYGVARAGAETGSNFGLTTRLNNRAKGDVSPEEWRQKVLKNYETSGGKLTPAAVKKLQDEQAAATRYNSEKAKVKGGANPETVAEIFKGIDGSSESNMNKSKLKNKALQAMSGYGETYLQGFRANRPGASRRVYTYRGTELGNNIMDTAARKIDEGSKAGDSKKVERVLDVLRSGTPRINEALNAKYGDKRLDSEVTEATGIANGIRRDILTELEGIK
jgi:hypothetical protein